MCSNVDFPAIIFLLFFYFHFISSREKHGTIMNHTVEALLNSFQVKLDVHLCEYNENLTHLMCLFLIHNAI